MSRHPLAVVRVVVPARDEADRLERHVLSLRPAIDSVRRLRPSLEVTATVVLDSCTDSSAAILRAHPWVDVVEVSYGRVGAVRAAGVARARSLRPEAEDRRSWVACTDADGVVPADWLMWQVRLAEAGADVVTGAVVPDPGEVEPEVLAAWWRRHSLDEGHTHVHGANLGFTLAAYDLAGGFAPVSTGEDVGIVERMRAAGLDCRATGRAPVCTSGRRVARAPAGFAAYLVSLGS